MPIIQDKEFGKITIRRSTKATQVRLRIAPDGTLRASLKLNEKRIHLKTNGYKSSDLELLLDREDYMKYITTVLKVKPDRIHTITTGMVILKAIADYYGSETIYISSYGVREGYLASKIKEK